MVSGRCPLGYLFILPKTHKRYGVQSIWDVTSTCSNSCMTPVRHTGDDMAYLCFQNLLPFLLKYNIKFLKNSRVPLFLVLCIYGSFEYPQHMFLLRNKKKNFNYTHAQGPNVRKCIKQIPVQCTDYRAITRQANLDSNTDQMSFSLFQMNQCEIHVLLFERRIILHMCKQNGPRSNCS